MKWESGLVAFLMGLGTMAQKSTETQEEATPSATRSSKATKTASKEAATHTVAVGAFGHKFTPDEVEAEVGDTIEWRFYPEEHWVVRGDFDNPCIPYEYIGIDRKGFSSGPQAVKAIGEKGSDDAPQFRQVVNDTDPIYFYCGAPGSCVDWHMMGIVNPVKGKGIKEWQKLAEEVDFQLRPGDEWPKEDSRRTSTDFGPKPTDENEQSNDEDSDDSGSSLGAGAIAGIAIGAVAVVLIAGLLAFFLLRRRRSNTNPDQDTMQSAGSHPGHMSQATYASVPTGHWGGSQGQKSPHQTSEQPFYPSGFSANQFNQQYAPAHFAQGGSPPPAPASEIMSPAASPNYLQTGSSMGGGYNEQFQSYLQQQRQQQQQQQQQHGASPKPANEAPPAELAGSVDPGNSPLPQYQSSDQYKASSGDGRPI